MLRLSALLGGLLLSAVFASPLNAATLEVTLEPTTTDAAGQPLTAASALTSHRVQVGACNADGSFGAFLKGQVLAMPTLTTKIEVPLGLVCVRAFPSNAFGEGKPYPVAVVGAPPSEGGSIVLIRFVNP